MSNISEYISTIKDKAIRQWQYCSMGIWRDTRSSLSVRLIKTLNLSARSFLSSDLQAQACALTYRTMLAIVPALALLFAIGRGFGFQSVITTQLYKLFPSQHKALETAFTFVDSYLAQASGGIFVGVGIVFLLWTLISLLSNVEDIFNSIWRVRRGRRIWRKATDYLAIMMILPILMICAGGINVMMSSTIQAILPFEFVKPAITILLDLAGWILTWLFFAGTYMLIPNARVKFVNALLAGILVGTAFQLLQWLFLSGQMYVAKYNAIYGSFSFLPLFLIWLQLVWLITLIGGVLCYASQNIEQFNFDDDVRNISPRYRREVAIAIMAIIAKRFAKGLSPVTSSEIASRFSLPVSLVTDIVLRLHDIRLINFIEARGEKLEHPLQPAIEVSNLTVGQIVQRLQEFGASDFIPEFKSKFAPIVSISDEITDAMIAHTEQTTLLSLPIEM